MDYFDKKPDLTRLPEHLKQTLTKPLELRPDEVHVKLRIYKEIKAAGYNIPNARLLAGPFIPTAEGTKPDGVQIELVDFKGHVPLVMSVLSLEKALIFLKGFIKTYKRCGGDIQSLLGFIEELEK